MQKTFLELHKSMLDMTNSFWSEDYKRVIIQSIENRYKTDVLKEWGIEDIVINGDKVLLKWYKRHRPLTDEEIKDKYGR